MPKSRKEKLSEKAKIDIEKPIITYHILNRQAQDRATLESDPSGA